MRVEATGDVREDKRLTEFRRYEVRRKGDGQESPTESGSHDEVRAIYFTQGEWGIDGIDGIDGRSGDIGAGNSGSHDE